MATFEAQVEGLTSLAIDGSSAPTQTELTQFLTDGAKEVVNLLPEGLLPLCSSSVSFTSVSSILDILSFSSSTLPSGLSSSSVCRLALLLK